MVLDVPNTLIRTNIPPEKDAEERLVMRITGVLVDIILELDSETYSKNMLIGNVKKVIQVFVLRSIYRMLVASLLLYIKFYGDLGILDLSSILKIHVPLTG